MNHIVPSCHDEHHQHSITIQQVLPLSRRRDLLISFSQNDSESSLEDAAPPLKAYADSCITTKEMTSKSQPDELRAYNISLARKLRRMKRRLLLEQALVLAQGPTPKTGEELHTETKENRMTNPLTNTLTSIATSSNLSKANYATVLTAGSKAAKINQLTTHAA